MAACRVCCAVLCPACAQVIIMQTPVGTFFKVHPINGIEWAISVAIGISAIPVSILTRLLTRACKCLPSPTDLRGHRGRRGRRTGEPAHQRSWASVRSDDVCVSAQGNVYMCGAGGGWPKRMCTLCCAACSRCFCRLVFVL
jgi:hypothetical protein